MLKLIISSFRSVFGWVDAATDSSTVAIVLLKANPFPSVVQSSWHLYLHTLRDFSWQPVPTISIILKLVEMTKASKNREVGGELAQVRTSIYDCLITATNFQTQSFFLVTVERGIRYHIYFGSISSLDVPFNIRLPPAMMVPWWTVSSPWANGSLSWVTQPAHGLVLLLLQPQSVKYLGHYLLCKRLYHY
jgi:hypothetical protein